MTPYGRIAVLITANRRPDYLARTLASWTAVRHIGEIIQFRVALGRSGKEARQRDLIVDASTALRCPLVIKPDSDAAAVSIGMHRALGEAIASVMSDCHPEFVVISEEDIIVSPDALEYMAHMAGQFRDDPSVLLVNGHDVGGQGWDEPGIGATRGDADPEVVRLGTYFNPWLWGTWPDRWERWLRPKWDWDQNTGTRGFDSGYDWNIQARIIPDNKLRTVTPDASRSQNIGEHGGVYAKPEKFWETQTRSFAVVRWPVTGYRLVEELDTQEGER